jgi:hypothetical protein
MSLNAALTQLFDTQRASDGYVATITRGADSCPATIVLGRNDKTATGQQGFSVEADSQDLFIKAAQYKPGGTISRPMLDDRIAATVEGTPTTWRVVEQGPDAQTYSPCDLVGSELRVHCKVF